MNALFAPKSHGRNGVFWVFVFCNEDHMAALARKNRLIALADNGIITEEEMLKGFLLLGFKPTE